MCDGLEITQFTYFQQAGGIELNPVSLEITYGVERLCSFLDKESNIFNLNWNGNITYGELRKEEEVQFSKYNFEKADIKLLRQLYSLYSTEAEKMIEEELYLPAFDYVLKCSHAFNILDARKAVSVAERTAFLASMRNLSSRIAKMYIDITEGKNE